MSFSQEVGQFFALSLSQSAQLEQALSAFARHLESVPQTSEPSTQHYQNFIQIVTDFGVTAAQIPNLMERLYALSQFRALVKQLLDCFYQAGGNREEFTELYQQILMDEQI